MDRMGPLLCLLSAAGFGAMAIFGKLAYDAGVEADQLLLLRFALATPLLLAVAAATGALRGLSRGSVLAGLAMGAIGYATQSGLYFNALERMDASLLALILYVYPALVLIGAVALGRERASVRRVAALLIALAGTALVLAGAASGSLDALGTAMGFGAALAYTVYILTGDCVGTGVPPVALAALVCLGATCTFALASVVRGGPELGFGADGWVWVGAIAFVAQWRRFSVSSPAWLGSGRRRRRSFRPWSRLSPSRWRPRRSGSRSARCSWSAARWSSSPCS